MGDTSDDGFVHVPPASPSPKIPDEASPLLPSPAIPDPNLRRSFVTRVYSLLSLQLLLTASLCLLSARPPLSSFLRSRPLLPLLSSLLLPPCLYLLSVHLRSPPRSLLLLFLATLLTAHMLSFLCAASPPLSSAVPDSLLLSASLFLCLSIRTHLSPPAPSSYLPPCLILLLLYSLLLLPSRAPLPAAASLLASSLFSLCVIRDTSDLASRLPPDAYVAGAASLYLDAANLLLQVLHLHAN